MAQVKATKPLLCHSLKGAALGRCVTPEGVPLSSGEAMFKARPIFPLKEGDGTVPGTSHQFRRHLKIIIKRKSISKENLNGDLKRIKVHP